MTAGYSSNGVKITIGMMSNDSKTLKAVFVRNFVFGAEDSLVSTVGFLSGIASAGVARTTILLSGVVLLSVEAFSMAVGTFLSERTAEEYTAGHEVSPKYSFIGSLVMLFTYLAAGLVPLAPYFITDGGRDLLLSIIFSLVILFAIGAATAKVARVNMLWNGLRTMLIGGIAIVVGIAVGEFIK